eukprot:TRINITY_DN1642_c0_g1_i1.p2 TRINITY_DN1642_c0_g1~~TRINITY_DN1642_c0_g1_i1.p2  ORF type:complete len:116 (-),score=22.88 TRINITY_DN1642_c0_g1_i1:59-406(-)
MCKALEKLDRRNLRAYIPTDTSFFSSVKGNFPLDAGFQLKIEEEVLVFGDEHLPFINFSHDKTVLEAERFIDGTYRVVLVDNRNKTPNRDNKLVLAVVTVYCDGDLYGMYHVVES